MRSNESLNANMNGEVMNGSVMNEQMQALNEK